VEEQSSFDKFVVGEQQDVKLDKPYGVAIRRADLRLRHQRHRRGVRPRGQDLGVPPARSAREAGQPVNVTIDDQGRKYGPAPDATGGRLRCPGRYLRAGAPRPWRPVDAAVFDSRLYVADSRTAW
jgi:hypothetical protein